MLEEGYEGSLKDATGAKLTELSQAIQESAVGQQSGKDEKDEEEDNGTGTRESNPAPQIPDPSAANSQSAQRL